MSLLTTAVRAVSICLVLSGVVGAVSPDALAVSREEMVARRAAREVEREERAAEREAARFARRAAAEQSPLTDSVDEPAPCSCRASLSFAKPSLLFRGGVLSFIPRVDISISSRDNERASDWTALVSYAGTSAYASDDVAVPGGVSFSGQREAASGSCGDDYRLRGFQLEPVSLRGMTTSLLGLGEELEGTVRMAASVSGCGFDEKDRQFDFQLESFGTMRLGSWRTVR